MRDGFRPFSLRRWRVGAPVSIDQQPKHTPFVLFRATKIYARSTNFGVVTLLKAKLLHRGVNDDERCYGSRDDQGHEAKDEEGCLFALAGSRLRNAERINEHVG
jgi:hypothetical protein